MRGIIITIQGHFRSSFGRREGMFAGASKDYRRVIFYADPNTGDRKVKVVVGIGDGRGYVDKKSFLLNGNKEKK